MTSDLSRDSTPSLHRAQDHTTVRQWLEAQRSKISPDMLRSILSWRLADRALDTETATAAAGSAARWKSMKTSTILTPRRRIWNQVHYNTRSQSVIQSTLKRVPDSGLAASAVGESIQHTSVNRSLMRNSAFSFYDAVELVDRLFGNCSKSKMDEEVLFALASQEDMSLFMEIETELEGVDDYGRPDPQPCYYAALMVFFVTQMIVYREALQRACANAHGKITKAKNRRQGLQLSDAWFKPVRRSPRLHSSCSRPTKRTDNQGDVCRDELAAVSRALLLTVLQKYRCP